MADNSLPGSSSSNSREIAFQGLQEQIMELEKPIRDLLHKISSLKCQQNQLNPIGSLPDEILAEVFSHLVYTGLGTRDASVEWIREVTHVCSRWRKIALQTPRLWSRPSFVSPKLTAAMIKRAKASPLAFLISLDAHYSDSDSSDEEKPKPSTQHSKMISLAIKNLPRASTLVLWEFGGENGQLEQFVTRCTRDASFTSRNLSLESLSILAEAGSNDDFPINLFQSTGSKLRYVNLRNWNLFRVASPTNLSWIAGVNKLVITVAPNHKTYQKSSVRRVVSCLGALQQLRILTLRNIFESPQIGGSPRSSGPSIQASEYKGQLPVLDQLNLESYPDLCYSFLTQIGSAPKTSLTVYCSGDVRKALKGDFQQLISAIKQIVANPDKVTQRKRLILYQADVEAPTR